MSTTPRRSATGLRQFLNLEQQRDWIEGKTTLRDAGERSESPELRLKYVARFQKLLRRPQAQDVLKLLRLYGKNCLPIPSKTERHYWSVSCLPSTSDKPLIRVNASWMELFTLYADGEASVRDSSCIFRISPPTIHPRRAMWTKLFSSRNRCRSSGAA